MMVCCFPAGAHRSGLSMGWQAPKIATQEVPRAAAACRGPEALPMNKAASLRRGSRSEREGWIKGITRWVEREGEMTEVTRDCSLESPITTITKAGSPERAETSSEYLEAGQRTCFKEAPGWMTRYRAGAR